MTSRRVLALSAVALGAGVLSGCAGSHGSGIVGLQRVGEHLHAYVQMCDGHAVDTVVMAGGTFRDEWSFPDPVTTTGSIDIGVLADAASLLDTGNAFVLEATLSGSDDAARGLTFVASDLAALDDREILVGDGSTGNGARLLDAAEFTKFVDDYCG